MPLLGFGLKFPLDATSIEQVKLAVDRLGAVMLGLGGFLGQSFKEGASPLVAAK